MNWLFCEPGFRKCYCKEPRLGSGTSSDKNLCTKKKIKFFKKQNRQNFLPNFAGLTVILNFFCNMFFLVSVLMSLQSYKILGLAEKILLRDC